MKKSILFFSALSICMSTTAQISLSTSDLVGVNKIIYTGTDTIVPASMIGFAGASQTWNMTALTPDQLDTLTFLPYSAAPNAKYPTSNLVMKPGYQTNYIYLVNSASSLTVLGASYMFGTTPANSINTPAEILLNFPSAYTNGFTNNYQTNMKTYYGMLGIDSVRTKSIVKKTVLVDAWGNLTTPFAGGPYAVLRVKETKVSIDTTDGYYLGNWINFSAGADSTTTYTWWAKTIGYPLAQATMDSTGNVKTMEWLKGTGVVGIVEQVAVPGISVYPNPAQYEIHFDIEVLKASFVRVYDLTGKLINEYAVKNNRSTINTTHFANGIYMYSVIGQDDSILKQGKFNVSK